MPGGRGKDISAIMRIFMDAKPSLVDVPPMTIGKMNAFAVQEGLSIAIDENRRHHELYLSDPRKTVSDKLKTVIRYPVK